MENQDLKFIGKRLRQLREAFGMTQTNFAKKVNLTQAAISQFEEGKRIPSIQALQKIAVGLSMTLEQLVGGSDTEAEHPMDPEKDAAIQALLATLKSNDVPTNTIIALNRALGANPSSNNHKSKNEKE